MIKNIIFDLGGVIVTISQEEALKRFRNVGLMDAEKWLDPYTQNGIFGGEGDCFFGLDHPHIERNARKQENRTQTTAGGL